MHKKRRQKNVKNNKNKWRIEKRIDEKLKKTYIKSNETIRNKNGRKKDDEKRTGNISNRNHDCNAGGSRTNRMWEKYGG